MSTQTQPKPGINQGCSAIPPALINSTQAAAIGSMGVSWWHAEVAAGRAPQPAVRRPRCTRWRLADVLKFWERFADGSNVDYSVTTKAIKASGAAGAKRIAKRAEAA